MVSSAQVQSCSVRQGFDGLGGQYAEVVFHPDLFRNNPRDWRQVTVSCNGGSTEVFEIQKPVFKIFLPYECSAKSPLFTVDNMNLPFSNITLSSPHLIEYFLNDTSIERDTFNNMKRQTIQAVKKLRDDKEITKARLEPLDERIKELENENKNLKIVQIVMLTVFLIFSASFAIALYILCKNRNCSNVVKV